VGRQKLKQFHNLITRDGLTSEAISLFQDLIWNHYREHGRHFPWRETHDPYNILVSEVMLQQTQTARVMSKYTEFLSAFPTFFKLARAPLRDVLLVWQGLGYNRRALALRRTAQEVVARFSGQLPSDPEVLQTLPGIGPYTATAVAAIAFNRPTVFIETNIRSVFLHCFFKKSDQIADRDILPLVEATLDRKNPREWYYALFDYGAMIKRQRKDIPGTTHHPQPVFRGSNREIRGQIIRTLLSRGSVPEQELISLVTCDTERMRHILRQLYEEGFIDNVDSMIRIK